MLKNFFTVSLQKHMIPLKNYNYVCKRLAGHSKWANIKHTKGLKDAQRGKMFTKLGQQIKVAIQEGGSPNPAYNARLQQVISQCKRVNMPVATIESVIKSTQKDKTQYKQQVLEIRGPGGCIILCEVLTPNLTKTRNDIATIIKKHLSKYSDGGQHLFEHKGIIEAQLPLQKENVTNEGILEIATNDAVECEAEDVKLLEETKTLQFLCDPIMFMQVQKKLEDLNYTIVMASVEYIPKLQVALSDSDLELCSNLFEKLENIDEVIKLHDNIA
ncbi:hypothetical protein ILUMI_05374 [Ignelater luminosus]|uniref:Translational activator of cytochrome c oxidase 1 n=1 Tax=Ignelater luminosus TaxID=2038154 RepID=A0A8K0G6H4_IGNLU|nr:hypothetical protein ILUMI_18339 [Ignelater luminosus]KAF2900835.1 hypothetical protein ILUMI_05374 [Ignelater luminosus]